MAVLLLAVSLGACGDTARHAIRSATEGESGGAPGAHPYVSGDNDAPGDDQLNGGDDRNLLKHGRAAAASDAHAVAQVVERYYAAAAAGNGAAACAVIDARLARGSRLQAALPAEYRPAPGSDVLRGKRCPEVEAMVFSLNRLQGATARVVRVLIDGSVALAVMRFRTMGEHDIALRRQAGRWRIDALWDSPLP